jgi:hypothetical protein
MDPRVPERNKKPGLVYAVSADGLELPVIDITHPAFAIDVTREQLDAMADQFVREEKRRERVPLFLRRLLLRFLFRRALIGRALLGATGSFVPGMATYLMKLGPDNLGTYAAPIDRRLVAAFPPFATRVRLRDVARLLAEGVAPALAARPGVPLHLINIAGGPSADSLNALILLRTQQPAALASRRIHVTVFDQDSNGPLFAARALEALKAPGAHLEGLDIVCRHIKYDWHDADALRRALQDMGVAGAVSAASSEGGLFDYGSDDAVISNLQALASVAGADGIVVGSVTRDDGPSLAVRRASHVATVPRSQAAFEAIARRGGWAVDRAITAPFSVHVLLRAHGSGHTAQGGAESDQAPANSRAPAVCRDP